jgi:hypothetical protein
MPSDLLGGTSADRPRPARADLASAVTLIGVVLGVAHLVIVGLALLFAADVLPRAIPYVGLWAPIALGIGMVVGPVIAWALWPRFRGARLVDRLLIGVGGGVGSVVLVALGVWMAVGTA